MKFKFLVFFFFIISCSPYNISSDTRIPYNTTGFAYIYNVNDWWDMNYPKKKVRCKQCGKKQCSSQFNWVSRGNANGDMQQNLVLNSKTCRVCTNDNRTACVSSTVASNTQSAVMQTIVLAMPTLIFRHMCIALDSKRLWHPAKLTGSLGDQWICSGPIHDRSIDLARHQSE